MVAKTGVARLALTTGAPVIPVAHWGTQVILPYGSKDLKLFPRKIVRTVAGPPVDLSKWEGGRLSGTALREATAAIMADVTALVAGLRGETPPAVPYDADARSRAVPATPPAAPLTPGSSGTPSPVSSGNGTAVVHEATGDPGPGEASPA